MFHSCTCVRANFVASRQRRRSGGGGALELLGDAGEVLALVEGVLQLHLSRPPCTVGGEGPGTVRAATLNFLHVKHLSAEGVPDRHEHHAVVSQLGYCCQPDEGSEERIGNTIGYDDLWIQDFFTQRCGAALTL